jgi:hypothetical protein
VKVDWSRIEPAVFFSSAAVVVFVLAFGVIDPDGAKDTFLGLGIGHTSCLPAQRPSLGVMLNP